MFIRRNKVDFNCLPQNLTDGLYHVKLIKANLTNNENEMMIEITFMDGPLEGEDTVIYIDNDEV